MAAPVSVDELLGLIRKSAMVDEARLSAFLAEHQANGTMPTDPKKCAGLLIREGILTYFQAEQFLLGKWRGFTIGKYKLLERIGFGGMGQVFLCEHMYMHRRVAIKVLPPAKAEEPAALGRFYREARAAGILDHPNIVRTFDVDQDGNLHFLVMEYVDGSNLLEVVRRSGPMDIYRAANYICQAAHGLNHAFANGLIHRDIKPGNLLVDREGIVKLLDLGLARFYQDLDDVLTLKYDEKSVLGTADYVAPEQTVNSHNVDIRADLYALGATWYFILAGHTLFPEGTVSQKIIAHQTKQPKPIQEIRRDLPEGMAVILERLLQKDRSKRFQSPAELISALEVWAQSPIPRPLDSEMPQLSPAARAPAASAPATVAYTNSKSVIELPGSSKNSRPSASVVPSGSNRIPTGDSSTIRRQFLSEPPPAPPSFAEPPGSFAIRERVGAVETRNLRDPAENTPPAPRDKPIPMLVNPFLPEEPKRSGTLGMVFLLLGVTVACGIAAYFYLRLGK